MNLNIAVISDVICPWCYVGKRRLEKAIAGLQGQQEVQVRWHPFQLNPTIPKKGTSRKKYRIEKFGSWERSQELDAEVIAVGKTEGIQFAFDRTTLIDVVVEAGLERQVVEAMLNCDEGMDVFVDAGEVSRQQEVSGVPFFVINKEITLSGAQQPETFLEAFRLAIGSDE